MDLLSLIKLINEYGPTPALIVLAAVVGFLIKQLAANAKADAKRHEEDQKDHASLKQELIATVRESETRTDERLRTMEESHGELTRRVNSMERDYLPRDEHYKEFSGWRAEINRLSDLIIQLWKEQKK